jgi:hypothetical protein
MPLAKGLQMACNLVRCTTCSAPLVDYEVVVEVFMLFALPLVGLRVLYACLWTNLFAIFTMVDDV